MSRAATFRSYEALLDHFDKQGASVGAATPEAYLGSARWTIQKGKHFTYSSPDDGTPRVGYYSRAANKFTALRPGERIITTHFSPERGVDYVLDLPESTFY